MQIKMIAAVSQNGVIGVDGEISWKGRYPEDFKFFRQMTAGGEVVFGRKTFENIGKPLSNRNNVVITSKPSIDGVTCFPSIDSWLKSRAVIFEDVALTRWICGGAELYREGMKHSSEIYLTLIPENVSGKNLVYFPWIDPTKFKAIEHLSIGPCSNGKELKVIKYTKSDT